MMINQSRLAVLVVTGLLAAGSAAAQTTTGDWELYPEQAASFQTVVQQPINVDGTSNFKSTGKSVIPIKFELFEAPGPVVFQSICSDNSGCGDQTQSTENDYSYLSFTPDAPLLFKDIENLSAVYSFSEGDCHGGALRWSVNFGDVFPEPGEPPAPPATDSVFIYYGAHPSFTDCTTAGSNTNQSGLNLIPYTDARFDTSQIPGGTFYDDYDGAEALVGTLPILRASLVLDGGWAGDQVMAPSNVTVNDNTFIPESGATKTCDLPPAMIQITKTSVAASGPVNEPLSVQPNDDDDFFRVVDCKYMYNLATKSLSGPGRYKVEAIIDGGPVAGAAEFDLR